LINEVLKKTDVQLLATESHHFFFLAMKNKMFAYIRPLAALGVLELLEDFMKYSFADFSQHEKSRISFKFLAPFTARIR
jgi:hypothetical protein